MAGEDDQASDDGVPGWALAGIVVLAILVGTAWTAACLALGVGSIAFPLAAVVNLVAGPVKSSNGFLHWWVSPSQGWLVLRAGWYAATVVVFVIWGPSWIRRFGKDHSILPDIFIRLYVFGFFLLGLLVLACLFAATDLQAAHDHAAGISQCFAAGPTRAIGSVPGVLRSSDAMYFAIGNLTTAGTGQVAPLSSGCRALVAWQTAIGAVVILFGVGAVITHVLRMKTTESSLKKAQPSA